MEIGLKYANFEFEDKDLLLGGDLENGLPTGDGDKGIGSDEVSEVEPFLDFGWKGNRTEVVGFISFGLPINGGDEEVDWELGWNLSALHRVAARVELLAELHGEMVHGGEEDESRLVNVIPGVKWQPMGRDNLKIGVGVGFPLTDDKEYHEMVILSAFDHF